MSTPDAGSTPAAPSATTPPTHLVLVGMMGSGKTSIGRRCAKIGGVPFVDADEAYIGRFGQTVAQTFTVEGEAVFRHRESELMAVLTDVSDPLVIACGGGAVVDAHTRARLAASRCFTVFLNPSLEYLIARAEAKAHRPLLADGGHDVVLRRLWAEREAWYREVADFEVAPDAAYATGAGKQTVATRIVAAWRDRARR